MSSTVRFARTDVAVFSQASHDRNPLHLSAAYARGTSYGQPVVFGMLAALACLGKLGQRPSARATRLALEFANPLFEDIEYEVDVLEDSPTCARAQIRDGRRILLKAQATFQDGPGYPLTAFMTDAGTVEPRDLTKDRLGEGLMVEGTWAPGEEAFQCVLERYELALKGFDAQQQAALLWASYLVGMELPGQRALFSRLSLTFEPARTLGTRPFVYQARVRKVHQKFNLVSTSLMLTLDNQPLASGEAQSFIREDLVEMTADDWSRLLPESDSLTGKVGLIIGASRGLGASIARAMCSQGATVLANYSRSTVEADALRRGVDGASGRLLLEQGDAGDPGWCAAMRKRLVEEHGRLDFLICNAAPSLLPFWIEPAATSRISDFIARSLALVLTPMAAFLDLVAESSGYCILVSSGAVVQPVADWPHYVSAKLAAEGLVKVAALEYPAARFLIVRPPRLLTDLTNTPLGRMGASAPSDVAIKLIHTITSEGMGRVHPGELVTYLDTSLTASHTHA